MKKILILLAGIVFLTTISVAAGCNPADPPPTKGPKKVKIYLKAHEVNGEMHLKMYDSKDSTIVVIDTLHTDVEPGTVVTWKRAKDSGIKKIEKIGPKTPGKIMNSDAESIPLTKQFKFQIPNNAPPNTEDKYDIVITDREGKTWPPIDPYLRIR